MSQATALYPDYKELKNSQTRFIFSSKQYIFFPQFDKTFSTLGNTYNPSFSTIEKEKKAKETNRMQQRDRGRERIREREKLAEAM